MQMWTSWCASYKSVAQKIIGSNLKKKRRKEERKRKKKAMDTYG